MAMHSYGGAVGTDAVQGLTFAERKAAGKAGGVIHLFYMCAYLMQPGATVYSIVEEAGLAPQWPDYIETDADDSTFPVDPVLLFFGGVAQATIDTALTYLVRFPMSAFETKTAGDAWKTVPVTYIMTSQDYAVPRVYQDLMLKKVADAGVTVVTGDFATSHSVFITKQAEMVEAALTAASDPRNPV